MISIIIISKDEPAIDATLTALQGQIAELAVPCEILVVDASDGRLDHIRRAHEPAVRWIQFERPAGADRLPRRSHPNLECSLRRAPLRGNEAR